MDLFGTGPKVRVTVTCAVLNTNLVPESNCGPLIEWGETKSENDNVFLGGSRTSHSGPNHRGPGPLTSSPRKDCLSVPNPF